MLWLVFALITAFSEATKDFFSKRAMKNIDPYVSAWSLAFFSFIFLLPIVFVTGVPVIGPVFWRVVLFQALMLTITEILYMKAIKTSQLSLTLPMLAFTPAFMLVTSPIILGELPDIFGAAGVLFIVLGAYSLKVKRLGEGFLTPLKALLEERGPILMLAVAFVWSITANVDKIGVLNSSPLFYAWVLLGSTAGILSVVMHLFSKDYAAQIKSNWRALLPIGFFLALGMASQMTAITMTLAAFVISIKRTSIFFGSLYGFIFFRETGVKERLFGVLLMVVGVFLITWF